MNISLQRLYILILIITVLFFIINNFVQSQDYPCNDEGFSIYYINGIFTDNKSAQDDKDALKQLFKKIQLNEPITIDNLYNPSHLAGAGDIIQTISQIAGLSLSNVDLITILNDLHSKLKTKKILLIGYSQGTFYTNEVYQYLIKNGIPENSIAVYNIATPASYVAGDGQYLTSKTDKVINLVRKFAKTLFFIEPPLPANIDIPLSEKEQSDKFGGHSLRDVYLASSALRIINEIKDALNNLSVIDNNPHNLTNGCFLAPKENFVDIIEKKIIGFGDNLIQGGVILKDTLSEGFKQGKEMVITFFNKTSQTLGNLLRNAYDNLKSLITSGNLTIGPDAFLLNQPINTNTNTNIESINDLINISSINDIKNIFQDISNISSLVQNQNLTLAQTQKNPSNIPQLIKNNPKIDIEKLSQEIFNQSWQYYNHINDKTKNQNQIIISQNIQPSSFPFLTFPLPGGPNLGNNNIELASSTQSSIQENLNNQNNNTVSNPSETPTNLQNSQMPQTDNSLNNNSNSQNTQTEDNTQILKPKESQFKNQILINEIYLDLNDNSKNNQWIELKNLSQSEINLANWSLQIDNWQVLFNQDDKIAPEGFFLLKYILNDFIPSISFDKTFENPLDLTGGKITLKDNDNLVVDEADFSKGWLLSEDKLRPRSLQRKDLNSWSLYLNDNRNENCLPKLTDKNGKVILGTPKSQNDFETPLSFNATIIAQDTLLKNANYWCQKNSPYIIQFSEFNHPILESGALLDIEPGTQIIFKNIGPLSSGGFNFNQHYPAFEIKGKLIAQGSPQNPIKITLDSSWSFNKNVDLFYLKQSSQSQFNFIEADLSLSDSIYSYLNIFYPESSLLKIENSSFKIQGSSFQTLYGILINRAVDPIINNNYFEGFTYPIFLSVQGEFENGQNIYASPTFKNNAGKNNKYNGIIFFSGNGTTMTIGKDLTLDKNHPDFPYIFVSNLNRYLTVLKGATLKIMPGVKIVPQNCPASYYLAQIFGNLEAQGTFNEPIIFTSSCANPQAGDWQGIYFNNASGIFKNVEFSYGGKALNPFSSGLSKINEMLMMENNSNITFDNVIFKDSLGVGVEIFDSQATFKNTTFKRNGLSHINIKNQSNQKVSFENLEIDDENNIGVNAINIYGGNVEIINGQIKSNNSVSLYNRSPQAYYPGQKITLTLTNVSLSGANIPIYQEYYNDIEIIPQNVTLINNKSNGIYIGQGNFSSTITGEVTLQNQLPYIISAQATIDSGAKLIINEGTILKINSAQSLPIFNVKSGGTLNMIGSLENPIYITDFRDDTIGGDTNNDGNLTLPIKNSWRAIKFESNSQGILKNLKIRYSNTPVVEIPSDTQIDQENITID